MTKLYKIEEQPVITMAALAARLGQADAAPEERAPD